jgi:hypothetical protein
MRVKGYSSYLKTGIVFLWLIVLYSWPMWWNGWPLVFNDTASYLETARTGGAFLQQSPGYGLFIHVLLLLWNAPQMIALAQTALVIIALWHLGRTVGTPRRCLTLTLILLGIVTPLPLICVMLLPDALFVAGAAALISLLLHPRPATPWGPIALVSLAMSVHYATAILFIVILLISQLVLRLTPKDSHIKNTTRGFITILVVIYVATLLSLRLLYPRPRVPAWSTNMVAQLVDDNGPATDELRDYCGQVDYSLCPYQALIADTTADKFLWQSGQALESLGGWADPPSDWRPLIFATIRHNPQKMMGWIAQRWHEQFFAVQVAYEFGQTSWDKNVTDSIAASFGSSAAKVQLSTKQEQSWFNLMPQPWPTVYDITAVISIIAPLLLWLFWRNDGRRHLGVVLLIALLTNALLMGTLSHPHNRYQLRLLFLPLATLLFAVSTPLPNGRYRL